MYWHAGSHFLTNTTMCIATLVNTVCLPVYVCALLDHIHPLLSFVLYMRPHTAKPKPRRPSVSRNNRKQGPSTALPHGATSTGPSSHGAAAHPQERQQYREVEHHDAVPPTYLEVLEKDQRDKLKLSNAGLWSICCCVSAVPCSSVD